MVTLRQLELLVSMADHGGITSGGARIGMSQSSTSHTLSALERELNAAVVDRQSREFQLTGVGSRVLARARDVFAALAAIEQEGQAAAGSKCGILRLGSFGASSSVRLLPDLIAQFRSRHPDIEIFVKESTDAVVEQWIRDGGVDLGVVRLPNDELDTIHIASDELVAVLPAAHPLAAEPVVTMRELVRHPFILTHAGSQDLIKQEFQRCGIRPRICHDLAQIQSIMDFVARGEGVSVVVRLAAPQHYPGVVLRPLQPTVYRKIGLACREMGRLSPAARAFWKMAQLRPLEAH